MQKIIKKETAITLIALVITIILLLILAGITISQLSGNGIFEKSKEAKEKHKVARQEEKNTLDQYLNEIDIATNRGQVTLSDEEYTMFKGLFSKNTNKAVVNIMKPNTWEVSTEENPKEYDFGDNVYGQRFTGTVTAGSDIQNIVLNSKITASSYKLLSSGGYYSDYQSPHNYRAVNSSAINGSWYSTSSVNIMAEGIVFNTSSQNSYSNAPYDIWLLYIKNQSN